MNYTLDERDFRRCCQNLLDQSEQLGDGWRWEEIQGSEEGYLRKTTLRSVVMDSRLVWDLDGSGSETQDLQGPGEEETDLYGDDEDDEDVCSPCGVAARLLQYECHILHSCSYGVPVLYFRVTTQEGRSLSLDQVWGFVHPNFRRRLQNNPLNTLTLQEHPLLAQPFYMLHPCRTEDFMRPILQAAHSQDRCVNYVLSWLSVVGPVVGLEVPLEYCTSPAETTRDHYRPSETVTDHQRPLGTIRDPQTSDPRPSDPQSLDPQTFR